MKNIKAVQKTLFFSLLLFSSFASNISATQYKKEYNGEKKRESLNKNKSRFSKKDIIIVAIAVAAITIPFFIGKPSKFKKLGYIKPARRQSEDTRQKISDISSEIDDLKQRTIALMRKEKITTMGKLNKLYTKYKGPEIMSNNSIAIIQFIQTLMAKTDILNKVQETIKPHRWEDISSELLKYVKDVVSFNDNILPTEIWNTFGTIVRFIVVKEIEPKMGLKDGIKDLLNVNTTILEEELQKIYSVVQKTSHETPYFVFIDQLFNYILRNKEELKKYYKAQNQQHKEKLEDEIGRLKQNAIGLMQQNNIKTISQIDDRKKGPDLGNLWQYILSLQIKMRLLNGVQRNVKDIIEELLNAARNNNLPSWKGENDYSAEDEQKYSNLNNLSPSTHPPLQPMFPLPNNNNLPFHTNYLANRADSNLFGNQNLDWKNSVQVGQAPFPSEDEPKNNTLNPTEEKSIIKLIKDNNIKNLAQLACHPNIGEELYKKLGAPSNKEDTFNRLLSTAENLTSLNYNNDFEVSGSTMPAQESLLTNTFHKTYNNNKQTSNQNEDEQSMDDHDSDFTTSDTN